MPAPRIDPWLLELIVVKENRSNLERAALSRDVQRGLLIRLRRGVYVERTAHEALSPEERHILQARAVVEVSENRVVFSHVTAAVLLGIPVLRERLGSVHTTVRSRNERGRTGMVGHLLPLGADEVQEVGGLLVTTAVRTVLDLGSGLPFAEGVMAADALLRAGWPRDVLEDAIASLSARKGLQRLGDVVDFAHPGAESAAESQSRVTLFGLGVEPCELQHRFLLHNGAEAFLDMLFPTFGVGGEVDGAKKLLDPAVSKDARETLWREKRREDALRLQLRGLARWGWGEARSAPLLGAVLRAVGVRPAEVRPTLADYAAVARAAVPRSAFRSALQP